MGIRMRWWGGGGGGVICGYQDELLGWRGGGLLY